MANLPDSAGWLREILRLNRAARGVIRVSCTDASLAGRKLKTSYPAALMDPLAFSYIYAAASFGTRARPPLRVHAAFISKISLGTPMREWQEMEWDFTFGRFKSHHLDACKPHDTGQQTRNRRTNWP
jgi:hypothetical protein